MIDLIQNVGLLETREPLPDKMNRSVFLEIEAADGETFADKFNRYNVCVGYHFKCHILIE